MVQLLLEPLGGAIGRVGEDDSALGRRDVRWCYHALSMWMEPGQETEDAHVAWAKELSADLAPHATTGVCQSAMKIGGETALLVFLQPIDVVEIRADFCNRVPDRFLIGCESKIHDLNPRPRPAARWLHPRAPALQSPRRRNPLRQGFPGRAH